MRGDLMDTLELTPEEAESLQYLVDYGFICDDDPDLPWMLERGFVEPLSDDAEATIHSVRDDGHTHYELTEFGMTILEASPIQHRHGPGCFCPACLGARS